MNILKLLGKVGGSILADVIPGGHTILNVVIEFLPEKDKLISTATGKLVQDAVSLLPADKQVALLAKEFDVEMVAIEQHTKVTQALGDVDKTGNSTRPFIARLMAWVVAFTIVVLIIMLAVAIAKSNHETLKVLNESWALVFAILATPTALLRAYFGMRTKEKQQKYEAISNVKPQSIFTDLIKTWKSK